VKNICLSFNGQPSFGFRGGNSLLAFRGCGLIILVHIDLLLRFLERCINSLENPSILLYSSSNEIKSDIIDIEEAKEKAQEALKELENPGLEEKPNLKNLKEDFPENFKESTDKEGVEKTLDYYNQEQDFLLSQLSDAKKKRRGTKRNVR